MTNGFVEEIIMKAQETESDFIFQTIQPYCENIIQKEISKKDLEQALLRFYKRNNLIDVKEWLSSFNTDSATCCFTAVNQLKQELEEKD